MTNEIYDFLEIETSDEDSKNIMNCESTPMDKMPTVVQHESVKLNALITSLSTIGLLKSP